MYRYVWCKNVCHHDGHQHVQVNDTEYDGLDDYDRQSGDENGIDESYVAVMLTMMQTTIIIAAASCDDDIEG